MESKRDNDIDNPLFICHIRTRTRTDDVNPTVKLLTHITLTHACVKGCDGASYVVSLR